MPEPAAWDGNEANLIAWIRWLWDSKYKDTIINAFVGIDAVHAEQHEGNHFNFGTHGALNGSLTILFVAGPSLQPHWFHLIQCEGAAQVDVYENPTVGPGSLGTVLSTYNTKRSDSGTATVAVYSNPGLSAVGTWRPGFIVGGTNVGGNMDSGGESTRIEDIWNIDQQWLVVITTEAALDYQYKASWYEED